MSNQNGNRTGKLRQLTESTKKGALAKKLGVPRAMVGMLIKYDIDRLCLAIDTLAAREQA